MCVKTGLGGAFEYYTLCVCNNNKLINFSLAVPVGAHPARAPSNSRKPMFFALIFCRDTLLSIFLIEPKHAQI